MLGVLFTIPLRRALVTNSDLPYPEGVAAAEVLKVGSGTRGETKDDTGEAREGLSAVMLRHRRVGGTRDRRGDARRRRRSHRLLPARRDARRAATTSRGRSRCSARDISSGCRSAWRCSRVSSSRGASRCRSSRRMQPAAAGVTLAAHTMTIWRTQVRFIGAGTIGVAAIYTLATLAKPVVGGLVSTLARVAARRRTRDDRDRDLSPAGSSALTVACLVVAAWLAFTFAQFHRARAARRAAHADRRAVRAARAAFSSPAICGYMAGLIGASNSPISGVGILSIVHLRVGAGRRRDADAGDPAARSSPSRCSSRRSSSPARRSRTTTCRISRPASSSARRRCGSRSR